MSIREIIAELNRQVTEQSQTTQPMQTSLAKVELQAQAEYVLYMFWFSYSASKMVLDSLFFLHLTFLHDPS